ncbi:MAG TPA: hypothetical protein VFF27_11070 [Bacteroidia bacterium]|nr:hypothetical protein [Bacteroidia bacterium]
MRKIFYISFLAVGLLLISVSVNAQDKTRSTGTENNPIGKIMVVPFEPKLYMSEIDKKVNDQTKWSFNQIRENFRHQLDVQLQQKFKPYSSVISFYSDSAKMAKDLEYLYGSTHLVFDPVNNPTASATASSAPTRAIKNGQVEVEMNDDKKFTNLLIENKEALPYFTKKYHTEYFVFINQLDIKNDASTYNITTDSYQRKVDIHYTIFDKNGKLIVAGIASSTFSSKENNPKKIVSLSFAPAANYIAGKFIAAVRPAPVTPKK